MHQAMQSNSEWERAVVLELSREHEFICRQHRVRLRPVAITLFDSESRWGQFDDQTRSIAIARSLVYRHAWHQVLGVFRHEMAHQWVAEFHPHRYLSERPHSELFAEGCRKLGVPAQYAKSGINLQTASLDWRTEPRDDATEKILERVKKLLALASSTNEHEALLAMERVRELYAKYNLDQASAEINQGFVHLVITHGKKRMSSWEQRIISILSEHFFVRVLTFRQFVVKSRDSVHAIELIGTRENVLMAEYVYHFLLQQTELLAKKAKAAGTIYARAESTSFRLGVLDGFSKKLRIAETAGTSAARSSAKSAGEDANAADAKSTAVSLIGQALEKFHNDSRLEDYMAGVYPKLRWRRRASIQIHRNAFAAGHAAGQNLNLNQPIASRAGNLGRFIGGRSSN